MHSFAVEVTMLVYVRAGSPDEAEDHVYHTLTDMSEGKSALGNAPIPMHCGNVIVGDAEEVE